MLPNKIAFVDIETTGLSPNHDRVIEVGVVNVQDNAIVDSFKTLVNPQGYVPEEIINYTGIASGELENAPTFRTIKDELLERLVGYHFVAHNVRFDYAFLRSEFRRENLNFRAKHFCTMKLSKILFPRYSHHSLDHLIKRLELICPNRHRAFDDAHVLYQFYSKVLSIFPQAKVEKALKVIQKRPSAPIKLPKKYLDNLPESPGVYIFYGKSINIKDRVLSHFANDERASEMSLAQQEGSIETIQTIGELGAFLTDSQLIKRLKPIHNRHLRNLQTVVILTQKENSKGYMEIKMEEIDSADINDTENILGIFKSRIKAKEFLVRVAKEFNLCDKLLGLEKKSRACFGFHIGRCKGACVGEEMALSYNQRLTQAFASSQIKPWPYKSAVTIEEKDPISNRGEAHVLDQWRYLGKIRYEEDSENVELNGESSFDLDTYKILQRYLKNHRKNIKQIDLQKLQLP